MECPICRNGNTTRVLLRPNVPVHQNLLFSDAQSALDIPRGELDLRLCSECEFVFNAAFDPAKLSYGPNYENTQECSPVFDRHVDGLVRRILEDRKIHNSCIAEVGCGSGSFLRRLVEPAEFGNTGVGFDPSYRGPLTDLEGRLQFEQTYFGPDAARHRPDAVVCRHVIEHISDPVGLLRTVRDALEGSPRANAFFETPCVSWILRKEIFWDLFYEHCSYFTRRSLAAAFEGGGLTPVDVSHVFEGQYLWGEAALDESPGFESPSATDLAESAAAFGAREQDIRTRWADRVGSLAKDGKVAVWGAGAKGVTFVNLVDPDRRAIDCLVDVNPAKQGCYVPGTAHPIVGPDKLIEREIRTAIVMNPNYMNEIRRLLESGGAAMTLIGQDDI